ncbi:MAG: polysulfide reductase NrfD [Gammaproteobacteria bacterium]|nr:polysulfide reductase NrfD [Gammaproteobacteria bacterium]MBU1655632.1 polysulfide reductase NrfD [Gammaproteobacteria bacterium]MBU1962304.1 polysulfide reductase NrfD [Gammaproteobacteria bacterium]
MSKIYYREWGVTSPTYWGVLIFLGLFIAAGGISVLYMEHMGHWVTGMTNQIVWGTPHVFAVFLIVAASGALNVASIGSVFNKKVYKPLAPLSGLLAITLLVGGLLVLVLDLGRPDRLIVAMTTYNFKSIFAWNIYLYTGFMAIVAAYLFTMMERKANAYTKPMGFLAFVWRLALTTGTGSIFGFLVARQAYDAAIMAPMFIVMSFSFGLAFYILMMMFMYDMDGRPVGDGLVNRLKNLLGIFVAGVLYFTVAYHLTNLYVTENHGVEAFILLNGGVYTTVFWVGEVILGGLLPLAILFHPGLSQSRGWIAAACLLVLLGGLSKVFVIIIGGQAFPMAIFPGMTIVGGGVFDTVNNQPFSYVPSLPEVLLGLGGIAMAIAATLVGVRMLKFLPTSLADEVIDPHHSAKS